MRDAQPPAYARDTASCRPDLDGPLPACAQIPDRPQNPIPFLFQRHPKQGFEMKAAGFCSEGRARLVRRYSIGPPAKLTSTTWKVAFFSLAEFPPSSPARGWSARCADAGAEAVDWVDWINPFTAGAGWHATPCGEGRQGSPRFAEMVVNARSRCRSRQHCTRTCAGGA
jgi:hypothetical protein